MIVRAPLLALHGAAILATHVAAGAVLGALAVTAACLAARRAAPPAPAAGFPTDAPD